MACYMCGGRINRLETYYSLVRNIETMKNDEIIVSDSIEIGAYHVQCSPFKKKIKFGRSVRKRDGNKKIPKAAFY